MHISTPTVGRTVLYVLPEDIYRAGEVRPATIVRVLPVDPATGQPFINLSVHLDGPNDEGAAPPSAGRPSVNTTWRGTVSFDQETKRPGTWHWMDYQLQTAPAPTPAAAETPAASESPAG